MGNVLDRIYYLHLQLLLTPYRNQLVQHLQSIHREVGVLPRNTPKLQRICYKHQLHLVKLVRKDVPETSEIVVDVVLSWICINKLHECFKQFFEQLKVFELEAVFEKKHEGIGVDLESTKIRL